MSDSRVFRFYDFYEAHQFAEQLEEEGHRTEVHEFIYSLAPFSTPEVRVVAFEHGLAGDSEEGEDAPPFGEFEQGSFGRGIDEVLRMLTASAICLAPLLGLYVVVKSKLRLPPPSLELFVIVSVSTALIFAGMVFSVAFYRDWRERRDWAVLVMGIMSALIVVHYAFLLLVALFSIFLLLSGYHWWYPRW